MGISGFTANIYSQTTSVTALVASGSGSGSGKTARSGEDSGAENTPGIEEAKKQYASGRKLLEKLDDALDRLRGDRGERSGRGEGRDRPDFRGYDRQARLERPQGSRQTAFEATQAEFSQTEISIGPEGISYSQTTLSYSTLAANGGSLTSASLSVTKAYLAFGNRQQAGAATDTAA